MAKSISTDQVLGKIILNENIYIYKKKSKKFYPSRSIKEIFAAATADKDGQACRALFTLVNQKRNTSTDIPYRFSALVLRYIHDPSFLKEPIKNWVEQKLAYLFLLDFGEYLILVKKNIAGINSFINSVESLDYEIISKLLIEGNTLFEKFSLHNLDISNKAMRAKSVESDNLVDNYNYIGSNTYVINHLRLNNDNQRYMISLNTSRISKAGEKISVDKLALWCYDLIVGVQNFVNKESYIDIFATPCNYEKERDNLTPITVTILLTRLVDEVMTGKITKIQYAYLEERIPVNIKDYVRSLSISVDVAKETDYAYTSESKGALLKGIYVRLNPKSIRLHSLRLRRVLLTMDDGTIENLIDYLNNNNSFVVNFATCDLVYSHKKLFKDSSLLGSIGNFLKIFEPNTALVGMTSEKGGMVPTTTNFDADCIFGFVESYFKTAPFLILDDLGDEWADHIVLSEDTVTFIHSKYDDTIFSATAFTDIVGQTQKNIGNMYSIDRVIKNKKAKWEENFKLDKVQSSITRLRIGPSVDKFIEQFINVKEHPNSKRAVFLALNFISLADLTRHLTRLKNGDIFKERKQAIQILWFISSLVASCRDNSIEVKIFCKP